MTNGDKFKNDPRIVQAKKLLHDALNEHRSKIDGVKSSSEELKASYEKMLTQLGEDRGRPLFFPYIGSGLGNGALVELADGSVKYDFISGIGVHYMGHNHAGIVDACIDAALQDVVMQGNLQLDQTSMEVSRLLLEMTQMRTSHLKHCFLSSSGAMANENAFKIMFHNKTPASRLLAFERCFSGRSMACAQMTNKPEYREGLPQVLNIDYVPFYDADNPDLSTQKACDVLKQYLHDHPGEYAGMCFELIQGEGGYYPGTHDFFVSLMKILKANNVVVMIDEIQTFGRTSFPFAFQYFDLGEYVDVVTVGKMTQVCATLYREELNPKPGLLSQTFTSSTAGLYASKFILTEMCDQHYFGDDGKIMTMGNYFRSKLKQLAKDHPNLVSGPYGCGAMVGFTYDDGSFDQTKAFVMRLYEAGVLSFSAGKNPSRVRFLIPIGCVTEKDIDGVVEIMKGCIKG